MRSYFLSWLFFLLVPVKGQEIVLTGSWDPARGLTPRESMSASPAPKYFKNPLKLRMPPQLGNSCLPAIMAYINQEQCGGTHTEQYYVDQYEALHPGIQVREDGVVGFRRDLVSFISDHFQAVPYIADGGVVASINAGHPILTTVLKYDNLGNQQVHNILIVGYDSTVEFNPKIYYMDPLYGRIFNGMNMAMFHQSSPLFAFSITGCQ